MKICPLCAARIKDRGAHLFNDHGLEMHQRGLNPYDRVYWGRGPYGREYVQAKLAYHRLTEQVKAMP